MIIYAYESREPCAAKQQSSSIVVASRPITTCLHSKAQLSSATVHFLMYSRWGNACPNIPCPGWSAVPGLASVRPDRSREETWTTTHNAQWIERNMSTARGLLEIQRLDDFHVLLVYETEGRETHICVRHRARRRRAPSRPLLLTRLITSGVVLVSGPLGGARS